VLADYEGRIAALERLVGKFALENEFLKGALRHVRQPRSEYIRCCRSAGLSVAEGCRLMGLARSTFYAEPEIQLVDEARLVERIREVCAEWPAYGYRRVTAELHGEGRIVNHKKVMRLMKENGLTVRSRRRFGSDPPRPRTMITVSKLKRAATKLLLAAGVLAVLGAYLWRHAFYSEVQTFLGSKEPLPLDCLYSTSAACRVVADVASFVGASAYDPKIFWIGAGLFVLVAVDRTAIVLGLSGPQR
jgi:hypothetical protein